MYFILTSKNNDSNTHYDYNFYNNNIINKKIVITGIIIKNNEDNNKITVVIMNLHISKNYRTKKYI